MGDQCICFFVRWTIDGNFFVKPSRSNQGFWQFIHIVCCCDDQHFITFARIYTRLYGNILLRILMHFIFIRKFIHIIEQNNGWCIFFCFMKHIRNMFDKLFLPFRPSNYIRLQSAFFNETFCHQCFAQTGITMKQNPPRQFCPEAFVHLAVF